MARKPKGRPGKTGRRGKFDEAKHKRERTGRFGNKPGAGDDAPKKTRRLVGEERLKTSGVTGADTIVLRSTRLRSYKEGQTVGEFVDGHPKGQAYALRKLAADQKKGVIGFEGAAAKARPTKDAIADRPLVDRGKLRPVDPATDGGFKDTDHIFSPSSKYREGVTIGEFVRSHPRGEAYGRKVVAADFRQGRLSVERSRTEFPAPTPRSQRRTITEEADWQAASFRTDDADLTKAMKAAPPVRRIEPIPNQHPHAINNGIHMDGFEGQGHTDTAKAVWRHEYGHHLDASHAQRDSRFASSSYASRRAMSADAHDALRRQQSPRAKEMRDELKGRSDSDIDAALRAGKVDLVAADLRTLVAEDRVVDAAAALVAKDASAYLETVRSHRPSEAASVAADFTSDAFEAITRGKIGGANARMFGHGNPYYQLFDPVGNGYTGGHGAEAFANYISLRGASGSRAAYRVFRHLAPESSKVFDAILATYRAQG